MNKILIGLGLTIIPFFFLPGYDTRIPKMGASLVFALALSLWGLYRGQIKSFSNKWVLIFIGYLLVNIFLSPKPNLAINGIAVQNFWVWQSVSYIIIFSLMLITVATMNLSKPDIVTFNNRKLILDVNFLLKIAVWSGFIMSVYCILQFFSLDQFYFLKNPGETFINKVSGTLGNPTVVSPFIAMIIPLALYLKKYWLSLVMVTAVIMTLSQIAIGAMVVSLLFYWGAKSIRNLIMVIVFISLILTLFFVFPESHSLVKDHYRFSNWHQIFDDMTSPEHKVKYPITGIGIGSFGYTYHSKHSNDYLQAHNEYMELFYNTGLAGVFIFLSAMFSLWKDNLSILIQGLYGTVNRFRVALLSSFLCISICAGGVFIWQLGATIYYTIFVVGLLLNKEVENVIEI